MSLKKSLSHELGNLINPEPTFEDPEDDNNIDTSDKWFHKGTDENEDIVDIPSTSKIRKKQVSFLSSQNKRYVGKKVSRNDLDSSDDVEGEDEDEDEEFNDESDEIQSDQGDEQSYEFDESDQEDELESENSESNQLNDEEYDFKNSNGNSINEEAEDISIFNFDEDKQMSKASSVKNQLIIFDNLLETRIKMQKLLLTSNRLPIGKDYVSVKNSKSTLLTELLDDCTKGVRRLGKLLLEIDNFVVNESNDSSNLKEARQEKRKSINFDESSLSKRFCNFSDSYRSIIDSWHERTKFVNANVKLRKFDSFEICPTKSIDQILSDKDRLIERTRIMRSAFKVIGQLENDEEQNNYNEEIYNDDDFYHQLLKQIIENKVDDLDDSTAMSRKFIEIQRMRNKLKKQVDTRASKGRKIRYDVHEKLVNFMAPVDKTTVTEEAKDELFKSLFGNFSKLS